MADNDFAKLTGPERLFLGQLIDKTRASWSPSSASHAHVQGMLKLLADPHY
jgi:hypothetical protein